MQDKSIYVKVYFRIESRYVWGKGMAETTNTAFDKEIKSIFKTLGFTIKEPEKFSHCSIEVQRGSENLYCHPMNLSGEIKQENIKTIENALKKAHTFQFRKTDTYDELVKKYSKYLIRMG